MKVNMREVAKRAGVSIATVSHVINNTRYVSEEVRLKVEASIRELDYVPDQIGRSLKTGKKNLIGFVVPDIANPVWALIIEEVENTLAEFGCKLIIISTKETESREIENIRLLASGIVDGIMVASTLPDFEEIAALVPKGFPMVFIDRTIGNCLCDSVIPEDYNAVYEGVERFILAGHKRIGIITGLMRLSTSRNRLNAYKKAMDNYGLSVEEGFIQYGNSLAKSVVPLVQNILDLQCTALVVSNNVMASDVLHYLGGKQIKVGKDLFLLGQGVEGDLNYNLRSMDLIVQPSSEIGLAAGRQIWERIKNPDSPIRNIVLYSRLIPRMPAH